MPVLNSKTVTNFDDAKKAAEELGYPVIIRVAYTLGGRGGGVGGGVGAGDTAMGGIRTG